MLRLQKKIPDNYGMMRTGVYSLLITRRVDGQIDATEPLQEFIFTPNPSDLDDATSYPNVVQPDHDGGFYTEVNEAGVRTLSVRGVTGHLPKRSILSQTPTVGRELATYSSTYDMLKGGFREDGYNIWIALHNFFVNWAAYIGREPHGYAMLFLNSKDAEVFQVLPMSFRKTRTSARPLMYGYALDFQIIGEENRRSIPTWMDRMNEIRAKVNQWRYAVNQTLLLASQVLRDAEEGLFGTAFGPVKQTLDQMTSGIQGLVFSGKAIEKNAAYTPERLRATVDLMFNEQTYQYRENKPTQPASSPMIPQQSITTLVPPDRWNVRAVYAGAYDLCELAEINLSQARYGTGESSFLNFDDVNLENYANSHYLWMMAQRAAAQAPLASTSPQGDAGQASNAMHQAARVGGAGILRDREKELASATLAGTTEMVVDPVSLAETRHTRTLPRSQDKLALSHLAATVVSDWAASHNERVSPSLNAFREWYLGMRDPATFAPVYRAVTVGVGDTIYSLAQRYLGSWSRWAEIALVNGLTYPFISAQGGPYQRAPGETINIPQENSSVPVTVIEDLELITPVHDRLTTQDAFLGFDVALSPTTGDMTFDVNDLTHIAGRPAFEQSMALVFGGSGGITFDPARGPAIRIGSKSKGRTSLDLWKSMMRRWLADDPRVQRIDSLDVWQKGDAIYFSSKLVFENVDAAVSIAGDVRV